jgi:hypothetical protein
LTKNADWYNEKFKALNVPLNAAGTRGRGGAELPQPYQAPASALLSDVTPSMVQGLSKPTVVSILAAIYGSDAEAFKSLTAKNITEVTPAADVGGGGPGFQVTWVDDKGKTQHGAVPWQVVPQMYMPKPDMPATAASVPRSMEVQGGTHPTDQKMSMLNRVWSQTFAGTKVAAGIPLEMLPVMLGIDHLKTPKDAKAAFEALRDPLLTDPRNPYRIDPATFFAFNDAEQGLLQGTTAMDPENQAGVFAGIVTPSEIADKGTG